MFSNSKLLNRAQKLMGILFTIMGAIARVLGLCSSGKVSTGNAVIVLLQILFSGIVVIYLDNVLKRGYGLLSSVSLFTAATIG
jgi:protein transport protein SEC61 subunit alpha